MAAHRRRPRHRPRHHEHLLSRSRESTEIDYRLHEWSGGRHSGYEEFRLARPLGQTVSDNEPLVVSPESRPVEIDDEPGGHSFSGDRRHHGRAGEQEKYFRELQNAIDISTCAGRFLLRRPQGEILYLNATLADWLDIDLTRFRPGSLSIRDICGRRRA